MVTTFHAKPFDEATFQKLEIFNSYLQQWLPVFVSQESKLTYNRTINIFDFFCGPGEDLNGNLGSPILAIQTCLKFADVLRASGKVVNLYFNDVKPENIAELQKRVESVLLPPEIRVHLSVGEFQYFFRNSEEIMRGAANLLFIDQCGIKEVSESLFVQLTEMRTTDFLMFIASSFVRRFKSHEAFRKYLDTSNLKVSVSYSDSHRDIAEFYRSYVNPSKEYYITPFSLKKGPSINGLIFGSSSPRGIEKFLKIIWGIDPQRGEANFDIDGDGIPEAGQNLRLFESNDKTKKVEAFEAELRVKILDGSLPQDRDVRLYSLRAGFVATIHAKPVLKKLKDEGLIEIAGQIRLGLECLKEPRKITIKK